jgi:1,4-dihydroxy-6-naphthoate synthase
LPRIQLAHSPDADDAFMFYGLATGKVAVEGLEVEHVLKPIQDLNEDAARGVFDVTAMSFHAYAFRQDRYALLSCGGSVGDGYGPVLVARRALGTGPFDGLRIAIPGKLTTAALAMRLHSPRHVAVETPFDAVLARVEAGEADAALVIHEGQLTYADAGWQRVVDLGAWWREATPGLPLPLGANAVRRDLGPAVAALAARAIRETVSHALAHREDALRHALSFGRGIDHDRADRFVGMYVNDFTLDYGPRGRAGIAELYRRALERDLVPGPVRVEFADAAPAGRA